MGEHLEIINEVCLNLFQYIHSLEQGNQASQWRLTEYCKHTRELKFAILVVPPAWTQSTIQHIH